MRSTPSARTTDSRVALLIDLGSAQRWAASDAFRQTLLDAASLAERIGDGDALVRAALANNRGGASRAGAVDTERVEVIERALVAAGTHDSQERARLLATLALELSQGGDWERRLILADQAVGCARRLGDEVTLLRVLLHTTEATRLPATLGQRLVATEELFDIAKRLGDPVLLGVAALREVRMKIEAAAFDHVDEALAVLDDVAHLDPYVRLGRPSLLAVLADVRGDFTAALAFAEEARVTGIAEPDALAVYAATTAQIMWDMGSLGTIAPMIEPRYSRTRASQGSVVSSASRYCQIGRVDEARDVLRHEVETDFREHSLNPLWLISISLFASLAIELDDADAARILYRMLEPWRGRSNSSVVSINGLVTESLAGLAVVAGDLAAAERDIADALEQAGRVGARVSATRTRLTRAQSQAMHGAARAHDALSEARAAQTAAREIGMGAVERRATELAQSLVTATTSQGGTPARNAAGRRHPDWARASAGAASESCDVHAHPAVGAEHDDIVRQHEVLCADGPACRVQRLVEIARGHRRIGVGPQLIDEDIAMDPMIGSKGEQLDEGLRLAQPPRRHHDHAVDAHREAAEEHDPQGRGRLAHPRMLSARRSTGKPDRASMPCKGSAKRHPPPCRPHSHAKEDDMIQPHHEALIGRLGHVAPRSRPSRRRRGSTAAMVGVGALVGLSTLNVLTAGAAHAASTVTFADGVLTIDGDNASNSLNVSSTGAGLITLNGVVVLGGQATLGNVEVIAMDGGAGNDTLRIDETNGTMPSAKLVGGPGNDKLTGGSASRHHRRRRHCRPRPRQRPVHMDGR